MSQELIAVPHPPTVLTVDAGTRSALTPRFLTLVVRACRRREPRRVEDPRFSTVDLPAAS
jgi:hypothetical protein